jgi:hypothetical protein
MKGRKIYKGKIYSNNKSKPLAIIGGTTNRNHGVIMPNVI